jgi:hypothetical protein
MPYELARITVQPGTTGKALPLLGGWLEAAKSSGRLVACWTTEIGLLNDILLLREYEDAAALEAERGALVRSGNPFGLGELVTGWVADAWTPFPFLPPLASGTVGPFFEVRTYRLRPEGLAATMASWEKALPRRLELSPVVTAMYSLSGEAPRFFHVWPYKSLDERHRIRAKAVEEGIWPPPGGAGRLVAMRTEIFLPAPFSPLR